MSLDLIEPAGRIDQPARGGEWRREILLYATGILLTAGVTAGVLRLWRADMRVPLNMPGDGVYYAMLTKTLIETGWVLHNPYLGTPFELDLYDFAHFDNFHHAIMKLITLYTSDWGMVMNIYYLLTFPLTALTALVLLRRLNLPGVLSVCFATLYACQPYHFIRGQGHLMLSGYYLVPLEVLVCLWLFESRSLGRPASAGLPSWPRWPSRRTWVAATLCLLVSSSGHYYACFGCFFFLLAGLIASLLFRRARNLRDAVLLCAVTACGFALNLLPNALYWSHAGMNRQVSAKLPQFSEQFGLRVAAMLLPISGHRVDRLCSLRSLYDQTTKLGEDPSCGIGIVAGLGFLLLLAWAFLPRTPGRLPSRIQQLSWLNLAAVLLATIGGFGTLFSYVVHPQLHGYQRMSIFIALYGLAAAACAVNWAAGRITHRVGRQLVTWGGGIALLALGLYDQTSPQFIPHYSASKEKFRADEAFGQAIQRAVPPGTRVFQAPLSCFPFDNGQIGYDHLWTYLHTTGLRWSYPAMLNRPGYAWYEEVAALPPEKMLETLAVAGFGGVLVDCKLHRPEDDQLAWRLRKLLNIEPIWDGSRRLFFDMRGYATTLKKRYTPAQWQSRERLVLNLFSPTWGPGFDPPEMSQQPRRTWRWSTRPSAAVHFTNVEQEPVRVALHLTLFPAAAESGTACLSGDLLSEQVALTPQGTSVSRILTVPPGQHALTISCDTSPVPYPQRTLYFRVDNFSIEDVPAEPGPRVMHITDREKASKEPAHRTLQAAISKSTTRIGRTGQVVRTRVLERSRVGPDPSANRARSGDALLKRSRRRSVAHSLLAGGGAATDCRSGVGGEDRIVHESCVRRSACLWT